jgi:hypothetical protein
MREAKQFEACELALDELCARVSEEGVRQLVALAHFRKFWAEPCDVHCALLRRVLILTNGSERYKTHS